MRFLIDQDVYAVTAKFLIDAGHDVILGSQINLAQASDEEILSQKIVSLLRETEITEILFLLGQLELV